MTCKNCGNDISENSKFCPHCGEKIVKRGRPPKKEETVVSQETDQETGREGAVYWEREPKEEAPKIQYRDDFQDRYQQREYAQPNYQASNAGIQYAEKNEVPVQKNPCSIIALVSFVIALVLLWFLPLLAIPFAIASLVLAIVGKKHASKVLGTTSLTFSILGFVIVLIMAPILFVGNIEITIAPGEKVTIFDYFKDAFYTTFHEDIVYGDWTTEEGYLFSLRENGTYYLYLNPEDTSDNYYAGDYTIESGYNNSLNNTQFSDDEYYYYTLTTYDPWLYTEGESGRDTEIFTHDIVIKVKIDDPDQGVLSVPRANVKTTMKKSYTEF